MKNNKHNAREIIESSEKKGLKCERVLLEKYSSFRERVSCLGKGGEIRI